MKEKSAAAKTVDEYIAVFEPHIQLRLQQLRQTIINTVPKAEEIISYQMPAYKLHGMLVYFAGYKNHIGFYPGAGGIAAFKKELSVYKGAKGSVQFPHERALPLGLVSKIVRFRVKQNMEKEKKAKIKS
jgi:uncharacterized protein YdhG (YjbR/CyaY superfamily)